MSVQFLNLNGNIYPVNHPVLTVSNRAFRYGDGLFETIRLMRGEIKFIDFHAERLQKGMKALKLEGGSQLDTYFLKQKIRDLVKRNKCAINARIRLTVYRDADGLYSPTQNKFGYTLEATALDEQIYVNNSRGLIVDVFDEIAKPVYALSNLKTCNSLVYVMAGIHKRQHALNEVFLLNQYGFLCEAMSANIFVVYHNTLYTPALTEGCVEGVMRNVVLQLAKTHQLPVIEAQINPAVLDEADEVFLTNASRGIQWVMGFNKKRYFYETSRFLSEKLNGLL